jgi:hypothetical protein
MGSIVKKKRTLLHDEPSIVLQPEMVRRLGNLTDAAVLQQLNYWMPRAKVEHEGRRWVYKTYDNWGKEIGISGQQVRRAIERLEALGVVVSCTPRGRTKHYAINYEHDMLDGASSPDSYQADSPDDASDSPDDQASSPTYKDLHETRQEITIAAAPKEKACQERRTVRGRRNRLQHRLDERDQIGTRPTERRDQRAERHRRDTSTGRRPRRRLPEAVSGHAAHPVSTRQALGQPG